LLIHFKKSIQTDSRCRKLVCRVTSLLLQFLLLTYCSLS